MAERLRVQNYRDFKVWQLGMDIGVRVYEVTKGFPDDEKFGIISQLRRAVASIPANIAEGHARTSTKEFLRHVSIALGSLAETATFLELAGHLSYGNIEELRNIFEMTSEERRMLHSLQKSLRKHLPPK